MPRVLMVYEVVGNESRENLEALQKKLMEDPPFRRVLDNGGYVVLKVEGVTIDLRGWVDPSRLGLPMDAKVSQIGGGPVSDEFKAPSTVNDYPADITDVDEK